MEKNMNAYIWITESLFYMVKINIVNQLYFSKINFLNVKKFLGFISEKFLIWKKFISLSLTPNPPQPGPPSVHTSLDLVHLLLWEQKTLYRQFSPLVLPILANTARYLGQGFLFVCLFNLLELM